MIFSIKQGTPTFSIFLGIRVIATIRLAEKEVQIGDELFSFDEWQELTKLIEDKITI